MVPTSQVCRTFSEAMEATPLAWGSVQGGHRTVVSGLRVDSGPKCMAAPKQQGTWVLVTSAVKEG